MIRKYLAILFVIFIVSSSLTGCASKNNNVNNNDKDSQIETNQKTAESNSNNDANVADKKDTSMSNSTQSSMNSQSEGTGSNENKTGPEAGSSGKSEGLASETGSKDNNINKKNKDSQIETNQKTAESNSNNDANVADKKDTGMSNSTQSSMNSQSGGAGSNQNKTGSEAGSSGKSDGMASGGGMSGGNMSGGSMAGMSGMGAKRERMSEGKGYPVTIEDMLGNKVTLVKKPERIAAISGTFLGVLYSLGGKSICMAEPGGGSPIPAGSENLPIIGKVYKPDVEKILEMTPDLVIAQFGLQNSIVPALKQSGINVLTLNMRTYEDVHHILRIVGRIIDSESKAEEIIRNMEKDKNEIISKLPSRKTKIVILHVTSQDVSVKLSNSIAGNVAEILKLENIAAGNKPQGMGGETIPFSMETIIEKDPDVILVTSMLSDNTSSKKVIEEKLGADPVWKELRAVKQGKIVFLPQKYFLYNAGADFVKGIEYMAKGVYPEVYGELDEER